MARLRLEVTDVDDGVVETEVRRRLYDFNVSATGIDDGAMLIASLRDEADRLVAGLYGWTWGGCAFVALLWVDEPRRRTGLGTQLLAGAEELVLERRALDPPLGDRPRRAGHEMQRSAPCAFVRL